MAGGKSLVMYAVKIFKHRKCSLIVESRQISIFYLVHNNGNPHLIQIISKL